MAVGVVLGHVTPAVVMPADADFPLLSGQGLYNIFAVCSAHVFVRMTVPLFFLIAGFLFFVNMRRFNTDKYVSKLRSRARSILVPYLLWNLLTYFVYNAPDLFHLLRIGEYGHAFHLFFRHNFVNIFWGTEIGETCTNSFGQSFYMTYPYDIPLWFLRDLMVMMLFAPLVYLFVKRTRIAGLAILFGCYLTRVWNPWFFLSSEAVFFFALGAYFAIFGKSIIRTAQKYRTPMFLTALLTLCSATYYDGIFTSTGYILTCVFILCAVFLAFLMASSLIARHHARIHPFLTSSCFFLFAFHLAYIIPILGKPISNCAHLAHTLLPSNQPWAETVRYLLTPLLTILSALLLYALLRRFLPRIAALLSGNR